MPNGRGRNRLGPRDRPDPCPNVRSPPSCSPPARAPGCGRASEAAAPAVRPADGAARPRRPGRAATSTAPSSSSATAPSGSPRSCRTQAPDVPRRLRRAARAARHRRRRQRRASPPSPTTTRRRRDDVLVLPGDTPLLRPATIAALVATHRGSRRRRAPCSPPARRPHRLRPDRARARTAGSLRIVEQRRRHRRGAGDRRDQHRRSTASGASLLGPGPAPPQPRQRPGRVLPHRRRRGAARRRPPGRRRSRRRPTPRPRASTTGCSWPRAEAELRRRTNGAGCCSGVTMLDPARPTSTPPSQLGRDVTLFPGTILQGRTVVGDGAEIGPDTRLVDCVVGARRRRRAHRRPRRRDRRRRPRRPVRRAASRAASVAAGRRDRAVLHCDRPDGAATAAGSADDGAGHQEAAGALLRARAPGAGRGDRRPPRRRARRRRTSVEFANGEIYCRFGENIRGADVFMFQTHCGSTAGRSTTRSWSS